MKFDLFRRPALFAGLAAFALFLSNAKAASRTWTSTSGGIGYWQTNTAWSGATAPVAGDDLVFNIPVTGGTRTMTNDFAANTAFNNLTFNANAFALNGTTINLTGNVTNTAASAVETINLNLNLQNLTTFAVNVSSGRIDVNGDISGSYGLTKVGAGTVRLQTTTKTYAGDTTVDSGTLDLNVANALPSGAGKGNVSVSSGASLGLRFNQSINGLNGGGLVSAFSSGTKVLSLGFGDASGSFSGAISNGSGTISLTKTGNGTQILNGINAYTGATTVSAGTLRVNSYLASPTVTVAAGATLGGNGIIGGNTTINGNLDPGATAGSIGTLFFNASASLAFNAGSTALFQLDQSAVQTADLLSIYGTLTLGGTWNVVNVGGSLLAGDTFDLFDAGSVAGSVNLLNLPTLNAGLSWDTTLFAPSGILSVVAVPEPSSLALVGFGGMAGLLACRRKS